MNPWGQQLPPGLILIEDFITELEEESLLNRVNDDFTSHGSDLGKNGKFSKDLTLIMLIFPILSSEKDQ